MKDTYGKVGFGVAATVAAVGLASAGAQTAQAEFTMVIPSSPTITVGGVETINNVATQTYDWTYYLTLGGATAASSGSYFEFALSSNSGYVGYVSDLVYPADWTLTRNQTGYYGKDVYSGGPTLPVNTSIGSFTIVTTDGFLGTYATPTEFSETTTSGDPSSYAIVAGTSGTDFASLINPGTPNADYSTQGVVVPSLSGPIPESPLPLPAAFWPGLMTLGSMAVIGGLRLRRRAV